MAARHVDQVEALARGNHALRLDLGAHLRGDRRFAVEAAEHHVELLAALALVPGERAEQLPGDEKVLLAGVGERQEQG
jgi:hypothetical protein